MSRRSFGAGAGNGTGSRVISAADVHWIAGFLDGEGWFGKNGGNANRTGGTIAVKAAQKDEWHVRKLESLLGGKVSYYDSGKTTTKGERPWYWRWEAYGPLAAGVMMTVYPLMSPRRQKRIEETLAWWRSREKRGTHLSKRTSCQAGHEYTAGNTLLDSKGRRHCRECRKGYRATYEARKH
jgi:hypothetical protein